MTPESLDIGALSQVLTLPVLWTIFAVVLGIFALMSAIAVYHWRAYAYERGQVQKTLKVYFSVSAILILMILVSLLTISF